MTIDVNIFLQICAGIVCTGGALGYLFRGFQFIKKPSDDTQRTLKKHQKRLENDDDRLQKLESAINGNSECLRLLMEVMHTILEHFEDGNHTKELSREKKKIEDYLFSHAEM